MRVRLVSGALEAQLRIVAAGMQAGNAGGLFQDGPPLRRLGGDQFADLSLSYHGLASGAPVEASANSSCTSRARTSLPLMRLGRPRLPFDAAGDLKEIGVH